MPEMNKKTVAVLGAGGIGKHHAKWWALEGAEVCAILGSSPDSVAETGRKLKEMFGFAGTCHHSLERLLAEESPDIVDVCTPPACHYPQVKPALLAGSDVLCEKPLVFDEATDSAELIAMGAELVELAVRRSRRFAMCTQYAVAAEECMALLLAREKSTQRKTLAKFEGTLVSPTRGRPARPARTWIDLAPHMLGALQAVSPPGEIDWDTLEVRSRGHRATAEFDFRPTQGGTIRCRIVTDHRDEEPVNVRRLSFDGIAFDILGATDDQGAFCANYDTTFGRFPRPDALRLGIRRFLAGRPVFDGRQALCNLRWLLRVKDLLVARS